MTAPSLRVRILGSGAGGGIPQWNCSCPRCASARRGDADTPSRTQSSILVSADGGRRWVLFNASPDVRTQLASFAESAPREGDGARATPIAAVVLSNADIDHCSGLLVLREGGAPPIYGSAATLRAITEGLTIIPTLSAYGAVQARELSFDDAYITIADRAGADTGVRVRAFDVASRPPPYMVARGAKPSQGDAIGLQIRSKESEAFMAYVPGVKALDARLEARLRGAAAILIDGTCFTDDEMIAQGLSAKSALEMGHAPLSGDGGTLAFLRRFEGARRVLVHMNNSNPIVCERSEARAAVTNAGVEVGYDGMELLL